MGLYPLDAPVDVVDRGLALGRLPRRGGQGATASAPRSRPGGGSPATADPARQGSGQYLNSILAKTEAAKAGYDEAILLDERGFVCEGSGENIFVVREGEIVTPPQTASILDGINRKSVIQIAARPRLHGGRARHRPRRALPRRRGLPDRHRGRAGAGARDRRPRARRARRDHAASRRSSRTPCTGAPRSTWSGSTWSSPAEADAPVRSVADASLRGNRANYREPPSGWHARVPPCARADRPSLDLLELERHPMDQVKLYDTTLRDGMQGQGMSLSAAEKVRVVHALDGLGVHSSRPASRAPTRRRRALRAARRASELRARRRSAPSA